MENKKIYIEVEIFRMQSQSRLKWKDIKYLDLQDDDKITAYHDEGYYSENNSWDPHYMTIITREVLETDEQCKERIEKVEKKKEELEKSRYEQYLKLTKEFDYDHYLKITEQTKKEN